MRVAVERSGGPVAIARAWSRSTIDDAWVVIACAVPFMATAIARSPADNLAYLVRAGDAMLRSHHLMTVDTFTFTASGRPWLKQQWGSEIILALLHRAGWGAIALARASLVGLSFALVYAACVGRSGNRRVSAHATIAGFVVVVLFPGALAARAQMFAIPLFVVAMILVPARDEHPARLWLLRW